MKIIGKLTEVCDLIEGQNERGPWTKQIIAVQTLGDYPRVVAVECFRPELLEAIKSLRLGSILELNVVLESRKSGDRYFTNITCLGIVPLQPNY